MEKPLREVVPFAKGQQYYEKYRPMTPDTFGCDIEFNAERKSADAYDYKDEIIKAMTSGAQWRKNQDDYYAWLENERKDSNKRYTWNRNWNDDYGPIDPDTWLEYHAEPERVSYGDRETSQDEFDDAHSTWENEKSDVEFSHRQWERRNMNDYNETWAEQMLADDVWENYTDFRVPKNETATEVDIDDAIEFIRHNLSQQVQRGVSSPPAWGVGEDATGVVEIRTRHMKDTPEDYDLIKKILSYVFNKETSGETSAHVHIGLPKDFTSFDILAMSDLVDEKNVQIDVGQDRDWRQFSQLAYELHGYILKVLTNHFDVPKYHRDTYMKHHTGWTISNETMLKILNKISRSMGTNLVAYFVHGTVEFRYFSSDAASRKPDLFIRWIKYFMTIPKIAKRRNSFVIGKGRVGGMKFERKSNGDIFIIFEESEGSSKLSRSQHSEFEKMTEDTGQTVADMTTQMANHLSQASGLTFEDDDFADLTPVDINLLYKRWVLGLGYGDSSKDIFGKSFSFQRAQYLTRKAIRMIVAKLLASKEIPKVKFLVTIANKYIQSVRKIIE